MDLVDLVVDDEQACKLVELQRHQEKLYQLGLARQVDPSGLDPTVVEDAGTYIPHDMHQWFDSLEADFGVVD